MPKVCSSLVSVCLWGLNVAAFFVSKIFINASWAKYQGTEGLKLLRLGKRFHSGPGTRYWIAVRKSRHLTDRTWSRGLGAAFKQSRDLCHEIDLCEVRFDVLLQCFLLAAIYYMIRPGMIGVRLALHCKMNTSKCLCEATGDFFWALFFAFPAPSSEMIRAQNQNFLSL